MKMRALGWVLVLLGCEGPPPPPPVLPAPVVKVAPPVRKVVFPPPPPEAVAAFADELGAVEDVSSGDRLLRLLLADPLTAERALDSLPQPDGWQATLVAHFARGRGEKSFEIEAEPPLPQVAGDAGVSAVGAAWVSEDEAPLLGAKPAPLAMLPLNTRVEVTALDGEWAHVTVAIAQVAVYGEQEALPARVSASLLAGRVKVAQLSPAAEDPEALMRSALSQADDEAGRLRAVALWQRAWRSERSERTRAGLLRASWVARRASTVVRAALARNLAPVSELRFAWACTGADPSTSKWLDVSKARPRSLPSSVCVSGLDARARCSGDSEANQKRADGMKRWLESTKLSPRPWLRLTVDARDPRQVFLVTTPLEVADPCSDFEEITFEAASGLVRRLTLPLGSKAMVVWVPVTRHSGAEFSVPSALSESQAISWLRSREPYRWTIGHHGDLQPSLGTNARSFEVPREVSATSLALAPERDCSCN